MVRDAAPDMGWLKADLIAYAVGLGLPADQSMTKQQILDLIDSA